MLDSQWFYIIVGAVGFGLLLLSLILDEVFDIGDAIDLDIDAPWLDVKILATGLIGFGAAGYVSANLGVSVVWILALAIVGFCTLAAVSYFLVLKPLLRQQSNSSISRVTYVGRTGHVILTIRKDAWGQIQFTDQNGAIVREKAREATNQEVPNGTPVIIVDIEADLVVVIPNEFAL